MFLQISLSETCDKPAVEHSSIRQKWGSWTMQQCKINAQRSSTVMINGYLSVLFAKWCYENADAYGNFLTYNVFLFNLKKSKKLFILKVPEWKRWLIKDIR